MVSDSGSDTGDAVDGDALLREFNRNKKRKKHKKFYGFFKTPHKVLVHTSFLVHANTYQIDIEKSMRAYLKEPVVLYKSRCMAMELETLAKAKGSDMSGEMAIAQKLVTVRCKHDIVNGEGCIKLLVGNSNEKRFYVACQNEGIRMDLRQLPRVPLLFFRQDDNKVLCIHKPSDVQQQHAKTIKKTRNELARLRDYRKFNDAVEFSEEEKEEQQNAEELEEENAEELEEENAQAGERKKKARKRNRKKKRSSLADGGNRPNSSG